MKKSTWKVFSMVMLLVAVFVLWQLMFKDGGVIRGLYNGVVGFLNDQWKDLTGASDNLLPPWGTTQSSVTVDTTGNASEVNDRATQ